MAVEWSERAKNATKAELEANMAYLEAKKAVEAARVAYIEAEKALTAANAAYNNAVLERNQALLEMMNA